jgi:hypothetical protein
VPAGLAAFFYLGGLWLAAPLIERESSVLADRLRAMLVLGIAIPLALGTLHLLYALAVWVVLVVCAVIVLRQAQHDGDRYRATLSLLKCDPAAYALLAATLVIVWPPLVRPLLDGDTLAYHLPIAAAFAQAHSIWTSSAPYWYYPPGSELFASGLLAATGRWSLPIAGILPAWLLCARLYAVARGCGAPAYAAAAVPLAFICTPLAAFQSGTLQNDLWLAAFFVEIFAAQRRTVSIAVSAFLKPFGWIEAAIAGALTRVPLQTLLLGFVPLALWIVRDGILLALGPITPPAPQPAYWPTTIAANLSVAVPQLVHGTLTAAPQCFVWAALIVAGLFFTATRPYAIGGLLAFALYILLPVSYSNGVTNYVSDASSLRYALPAFACGALVAAVFAARLPAIAAVCTYAVAAWGAYGVLSVFWNDAYTRYAPVAAAIAILATLTMRRTRAIPAIAVLLAVLIAGASGAANRAAGFYADWMRGGSGKPTGAFAWIAENRPARIVSDNVRAGAVIMSSPHTLTLPSQPGKGCALAKKYDAVLFTGSNEDIPRPQLERTFADARACGNVLYADGAAVIVKPTR